MNRYGNNPSSHKNTLARLRVTRYQQQSRLTEVCRKKTMIEKFDRDHAS